MVLRDQLELAYVGRYYSGRAVSICFLSQHSHLCISTWFLHTGELCDGSVLTKTQKPLTQCVSEVKLQPSWEFPFVLLFVCLLKIVYHYILYSNLKVIFSAHTLSVLTLEVHRRMLAIL